MKYKLLIQAGREAASIDVLDGQAISLTIESVIDESIDGTTSAEHALSLTEGMSPETLESILALATDEVARLKAKH